MKRLNCLIMGFLLAISPLSAWAGAYDQLIEMSGGSANVPDASGPTPADGTSYESSSGSNENYNSYYDSAAAEEGRRARRIERERKAQQRREERKRSEQRRRDEREEKEDKEWLEQQALRKVTLKQLPPAWQLKSKPAKVGAGVPSSSSGNELATLGDLHKQIAELRKNPLDNASVAKIAELKRRFLQLWGKLVNDPATPDRVRRTMRLPIGIAPDGPIPVPALSQDMLRDLLTKSSAGAGLSDGLSESVVPVKNGLVNFSRDYIQDMINAAPAEALELVSEGELHGLVENLPVVAKITMAFHDGGVPSATAAAADFVVGLVPLPNASIAEAGRKIYVNTAMAALNNFMERASEVTGMNHDRAAFWQDLKQQSSTAQRAFIEWLGVENEK